MTNTKKCPDIALLETGMQASPLTAIQKGVSIEQTSGSQVYHRTLIFFPALVVEVSRPDGWFLVKENQGRKVR